MALIIDSGQVREEMVNDVEGVVIPVIVPLKEIEALLAAYNPDENYSPSAGDSREIARLLLDALRQHRGV